MVKNCSGDNGLQVLRLVASMPKKYSPLASSILIFVILHELGISGNLLVIINKDKFTKNIMVSEM